MDQLPHLFPRATGTVERYTYARPVGSAEFRVPPRDDRVQHSQSLVTQLQSAEQQAKTQVAAQPTVEKPKGVVLDFQSDPKFKLQLKSLESDRSGIELRNSRVDANGIMHATVFIPDGKVGLFVRKFEAYADPAKDSPKGTPKNNELVASISQIRLAALESFWMDAGEFPREKEEPLWWEVWLREALNPYDVVDVFRQRAQAAGVLVSQRELRFPDRRVVLARATITQLLAIENLFDILAELRFAKILAGEFLDLPPRDQADFIQDALARIVAPPIDAPSVCHLDTGVNRGHPLLGLALAEEHLLAVDPTWRASDGHPQQHGTGMAGLALYGCLTELLNSTGPISLLHRLESVKILPDHGQHDPDLYGDVTAQSIARIEIVAPERERRAFALTITADSSDEGFLRPGRQRWIKSVRVRMRKDDRRGYWWSPLATRQRTVATTIPTTITLKASKIRLNLGMRFLWALSPRRPRYTRTNIGIGNQWLMQACSARPAERQWCGTIGRGRSSPRSSWKGAT